MQTAHVTDSIIQVTSSQNFWLYIGLIIAFGMIVGGKLNDGFNGFKKSLVIIFPFIFVLFITNASRVYYYSLSFGLGAQSYNNTISLLITSLSYFIGLFIGHLIVSSAVRTIAEKNGIDKSKIIEINRTI